MFALGLLRNGFCLAPAEWEKLSHSCTSVCATRRAEAPEHGLQEPVVPGSHLAQAALEGMRVCELL